jgi:hypothetical protein
MRQRYLTDRRRFLLSLGVGGMAPLLGVFARSLSREALGQEGGGKRLLFYVDGMGRPAKYWPKRTGTPAELNMGAYTPLEPLKNDILVVDGLFNPFNVHLHGSNYSWTCLNGLAGEKPGPYHIKPAGPTIDRVIGATLSKAAPYSALSMFAFQKGPYFNNAKAADGPSRPAPPLPGPLEAYDQVIAKLAAPSGGGAITPEPASQRLAAEKSVFDFVRDDIQRLNARLAAPERAKLEQYTTSITGLEQTLARLGQGGGGTCRKPNAPDAKVNEGGRGQYYVPERMTASLEFVVAALTCGLTNVMVLHTGTDGSMPFLGDPKIGTHGHGHNDGPEQHLPYIKYQSENMLWLRTRLAAVPDAGGTFADSTTILYTDEHGGKHHAGYYDTWFMAIGGARVLPTGKFLQLPRDKIVENDLRAVVAKESSASILDIAKVGQSVASTFLGDFFAALANALGVRMDTFGDPRFARGPISFT